MKDPDRARGLAEAMVAIGTHSGVRTEAFITDMEAPLGSSVGNALEIIECLDTLKGSGSKELAAVATRLASRMVVLAGLEKDAAAATARVETALSSGGALATFERMIEAQGGNPRVVHDYALFPAAPEVDILRAERSGFVTAMKAEGIGRASNALGAGRDRVGDAVDHAVGIVTQVDVGGDVVAGQALMHLHHRDGRGLEAALAMCRAAVTIGDERPAPRVKILGEVR